MKVMDFSVAVSSACDGLAQLAFSTFWAVELRSVVYFSMFDPLSYQEL
jgi:hypothetical protein